MFTFAIQDRSRGQLTLRVFHNEECVCFTSVPLTCLRVGYRSMTLFEENEDNNYQIEILPMSKLFLRIGFLTADESGKVTAASPLRSDYSREFCPAPPVSSPSPMKSQDHNSRMVGMDLSPGNKQWKRLQSRPSDTIPEEPEFNATLNMESSPKTRHSDRYLRRGSTTDNSLVSSSSRSSHRERRRSRTEGRSKRDKSSRS